MPLVDSCYCASSYSKNETLRIRVTNCTLFSTPDLPCDTWHMKKTVKSHGITPPQTATNHPGIIIFCGRIRRQCDSHEPTKIVFIFRETHQHRQHTSDHAIVSLVKFRPSRLRSAGVLLWTKNQDLKISTGQRQQLAWCVWIRKLCRSRTAGSARGN